MRLSTSTNIYFNRPGGRKAPIEQSIQLCAAAGYHVMDFNFHDCTTFRLPFIENSWQSWLNSIMETAVKSKITFSQAHGPFYNFCDNVYKNKEWYDKMIYRAIDCAAELRIPWIVFHAGTDFDAIESVAASKRKNMEYFLPLVEYAEKRSVGIAIENLWDLNIAPKKRYTASIDELVDLVDGFRCPSVGICFDVEHATVMKQPIRESLRYIGKRLKATHISDVADIVTTETDHKLPFDGITNWTEVMRALADIQYTGDFTYETHNFTKNIPDALIPSALTYSVRIGEHLLRVAEGEKHGEL